MTKPPTNIPASIRARLLDGAKRRGEDFQLVLQRYGAERFLYRLGESDHRERFVLRGAMLFALWGGSLYRATRDLDLTGFGPNNKYSLTDAIREICQIPCALDGIEFLPDSVRAEPIRDESEYLGFRVRLEARLAGAIILLQVDVGFGNAIVPAATDEVYPVLLDGPPPRIRAYPCEAVVAEKFHAMVVLGAANTRMKDFYDLVVISVGFAFSGSTLAAAIAATFERRATPIPVAQPASLSPAFYADAARATQWRRYLQRNGLPGAPTDFDVVRESLRGFLDLPLRVLAEGREFSGNWEPGGPWK